MNPYRLYLGLEFSMSLLLGIIQTTAIVYWVSSGHFNPLQLVLLGTFLEGAYFILQVPTGILADLVSRRLCVVAGVLVTAAGFVVRGVSPLFPNQVLSTLLVAVGAALMYGALEAWIAGELQDAEMTRVYIRATQLGLVGTIGGSLLSGLLASVALNLPALAGGAVMGALGLVLVAVMPEGNVDRAEQAAGFVAVARQAVGQFREQAVSSSRVLRAVPALLLIFGMTFFVGMWSETFDRLWGAYLLKDVSFPAAFHVTVWFSLIACVVALLALGTTELAQRRTKRLGPHSVVPTLLGMTTLTGGFVLLMTLTHSFYVAVLAYLAVAGLRPVYEPLVSGWIVSRVDQRVSATALSARDMFDSGGQIIGGPAVGVIGVLTTIRVALAAGAAALLPAVMLLLAAARRVRWPPRGKPADSPAAAEVT